MRPPTDSFPLHWPIGWPRAKRPRRAQFDTSFGAARDNLINELRLLGATDMIISSNMSIRRDGLPYANQGQMDDVGIAVYFTLNGNSQCIPCDKWDRLQDNLQAIRKTVEALRGLERWGAKEMVDAAFQGFRALPASIEVSDNRAWWEVLGVPSDAGPEQIKRAYMAGAKRWHPDKPDGDAARFNQIKNAYEQATSMGQRV